MNTSPTVTYAVATALLLSVVGVGIFTLQGREEGAQRNVLSYEHVVVGTETVVKYVYRGEKVPDKLAEDEVVSLRTDSSYTRHIGTENEGTKDEKPILNAIVYMTPQFVQEGDGWYYRETATSTESAFYRAHPEKYVARIFANVAHAASLTPFSSSGDGEYYYRAFGTFEESAGFGNCLLESHGNGVSGSDTSDTVSLVEAYYSSTGFGSCRIYRTRLPFDTSSLGAGATVSAATLSVYVTAKANGDNDGDDLIVVVQGATSFGSFGSTSGATSLDISSVTTSAYNTFTLNATGRGWISTTGTTNLGLRENHDLLGDIASSGAGNSITISTSEHTGTSQDPYMSITYTPGANFAFWQFQDF